MMQDEKDIAEALETIKAIEMFGFFMEKMTCELRYAKSIFHVMDILRKQHDELVSLLPPEVIAEEKAKQGPSQPMTKSTVAMGVA